MKLIFLFKLEEATEFEERKRIRAVIRNLNKKKNAERGKIFIYLQALEFYVPN